MRRPRYLPHFKKQSIMQILDMDHYWNRQKIPLVVINEFFDTLLLSSSEPRLDSKDNIVPLWC